MYHMEHISWILSPIDDWFYALGIVNSAQMIISMHVKLKKRQEMVYFKEEGSHPDFSI